MDILNSLWDAFSEVLLPLLPLSPFTDFLESFASWEYLGWVNWFFPFKQCLQIFSAWTAAIALYYGYSVVLRWLKIVGD